VCSSNISSCCSHGHSVRHTTAAAAAVPATCMGIVCNTQQLMHSRS
jgi:hypothetical protein